MTLIPLTRLDEMSRLLKSEDFLNFAVRSTALSSNVIRETVETALEEAAYALDILGKYEFHGKRILEVGSGAGIVSACLRLSDIEVTSLEPSTEGFDIYHKLNHMIQRYFGFTCFSHLAIPIEQLDPQKHSVFDFIFSINVLEHIHDLGAALSAMTCALSQEGIMIHLCPNYAVPFEPHYGIPLIPFKPRLTHLLLSHKVKEDVIWKSLNFITYREVIRFAKKLGCTVRFKKEVMYKNLERLGHDKGFLKRHQVLSHLYNFLRFARITACVRRLPHQISSPMVFEWYK
jgi:2-polyprenyl-3-methyl-5-hydroxy-6-metoxy-1,4-benzoquinol methylase